MANSEVRGSLTRREGWFYEGTGIYRHVDLVRADPLHIPQWGTVDAARSCPTARGLTVATAVFNSGDGPVSGTLLQSVQASLRVYRFGANE